MKRPYSTVVLRFVAAMVGCCFGASATVWFEVAPLAPHTSDRVVQGGDMTLRTTLTPDSGQIVGGIEYSLVFPDSVWWLTGRDYGSHGWLQQDSLYDHSDPAPASLADPVLIMRTLHGRNPEMVDIVAHTARPYGEGAGGLAVIEDIHLHIPLQTPPGEYLVYFGMIYAYDEFGIPLPVAAGPPLPITVHPIPEPTPILLLGLAVAAGLALRRGRPMRDDGLRGGEAMAFEPKQK